MASTFRSEIARSSISSIKAEEAQRLHRKFHRDATGLTMLLRDATRGDRDDLRSEIMSHFYRIEDLDDQATAFCQPFFNSAICFISWGAGA